MTGGVPAGREGEVHVIKIWNSEAGSQNLELGNSKAGSQKKTDVAVEGEGFK
jgi:hypothetical protein